MKKLLNKGRVIVSFVSVFAILAVSMLSMFAGTSLFAAAEDVADSEAATVTYPLNGTYDSDFVGNDGDGVYYTETKGTKISYFTDYDTNFITNAKGSGTQSDPYIIETANQFAAVVTGNLYDAHGSRFSTQYVAFKVDEDIKAFDLNNTGAAKDAFSGDMTAEEVATALKDANVTIVWKSVNPFMGRLDGSGVEVYGLKATDSYAGLIPHVSHSATVTNITVKNSYFYGRYASAFIAYNNKPNSKNDAIITYRNISAHNNVIISNATDNEVIDYAGVVIGKCFGDVTEMNLSDSLIYDNIAKHETRDVTYGLVGKLHRRNSAVIKNCIIMDSAPHTLYYGSNAFNLSTYTNVYTNKCTGEKWYNYDGVKNSDGTLKTGIAYEYQYTADAAGVVKAWFDRKNNDGKSDVNSGNGFAREIIGPMYNVAPADVQGEDVIDGLDEDRWTYHESGYPTPKVYNLKKNVAGVASYEFFEGDGSANTPYMITNAEELALMLISDNTNKNYRLANDIAINDTSVENWTENAKTWFTSNDVPEFKGNFDGNGKTVSGLYYDGSQIGEYAGLIPVIGSPGEVKLLTVANSSLTAKTGAVGAVVGAVGEKASKVIKFNAITIEDTVKFGGGATKGGIAGHIGYSVVQINNSISKSAGLFGDSVGLAKLNACISVNSYPFVSSAYIEAKNIYTNIDGDKLSYTDLDGNEINGLTVIDVEQMKGNAAATNMAPLGFTGDSATWKVISGNFPAPTGAETASNGAKGEPWSGAIATGYAAGSGTKDDPWLIETAEQLARCIYDPRPNLGAGKEYNNNNIELYYKLTADIYLNDVDSPMWADKIGCNQWFTHRTTKAENNFKHVTLDGDGYVIYGMFYDHTGPQSDYVRVGLVPQLCEAGVLKNIAVASAYLDMNHAVSDYAGTLVGNVHQWNEAKWPMVEKDALSNAEKRQDDEFQANQPKIINCMADAKCYVYADEMAGGLVGNTYGTILMENCAYFGSVEDNYDDLHGGAFIGNEYSKGTTVIDCISLPQTCNTVMGGFAGQTWRTGNPNFIIVTWSDVYYFATNTQRCADDGIVKLSNPSQRIGGEAVKAMPGLDWIDEYDQDYYDADSLGYTDPRTLGKEVEKEGDATTWIEIDGGTPIPSIFAKHRDAEQLLELSDTNFSPPEVTVSFVTGTNDVVVDSMRGKMYSKLSLPTITRDGYTFTGWYVFDDLSLEYPKDYFPPRDLQLYAGWELNGVVQDFENYADSIWDYSKESWHLNKPGAKGGYNNAYVRNGAKSMRLLDTNTEPANFLINYEDMLEPGQAYTIKFWVTTDKAENPATLLTLIHNEKPVYLDTQVAAENMAVVTGLKVGEWVQYSYSFTAQTKWASIRATSGASLYFDDIVIAKIDGTLNGGNLIGVGTGSGAGVGTLSPSTGDAVTVAVLISAIMACAVVAVISKKNLVEVID